MRYKLSYFLFFIQVSFTGTNLMAQDDVPNDVNSAVYSGYANAVGKWASTPINLYTGIPAISVPIYQYRHHNGLNLDISMEYFGGGTKINELPTPAGLNWFLSAGGAISRTVRGMPDDLYPKGSMYNSVLPGDPTVNAYNYYHDSLDAEIDVFQYNFNGRSGKFYIGKNSQIRIVPLSKLKISFDTASGGISVFRVTAEDGVKYVFRDREYGYVLNTDFKCGYNGKYYASAWYLSQIIAPFGTDTIKFTYNITSETPNISFPQTVYVNNSNTTLTQYHAPVGSELLNIPKLASITFPDKKNISFLYDRSLRYDGTDSLLNRINIGDSIFRYGFIMNWIPSTRALLSGIQLYTPTSARNVYQFSYSGLQFAPITSTPDPLAWSKDHWGFYNGASNGTNGIPTVTPYYTGANRNPSATYSISSTLNSITDVSGGITYYQFEPNDLPQYTMTPNEVFINALNNTQNTITLNNVFGNLYTMYLAFDQSYGRNGVLTGTCPFTCSVTSLDGLTTYGSITTTLYQLATGINFSFNAPNGSYLLKTTISSCSCTLTSLPVDIDWQNQTLTGNSMITGGVRLKTLSHFDPVINRTDTIVSYIYKTSDGKSSGFLGAIPIYSYPYSQTVINGTTVTTSYTAITSDPINDLNYTQGSPIGYSHVEVTKGSPTHNLGKTTYDFRTLTDASVNLISPFFPYAPFSQREWILGLPKRVAVYDSLGRIISIRYNTYSDTLISDTNVNFRSRKLGKVSTTFNGNPTNPSTPVTETYINADYFPETGTSLLTKAVDSFYHSDNSLQIVEHDMQYDTSFNLTKSIEPFDQTRGLSLEKRFYYPYNYTLASGAIKKLKDSSILSTLISTENWITGDANPRIMGAQITDFQQLSTGHIKPLTVYNLQSNGPIGQSTIGVFNPSTLVRNTTYLIPQQNFPTYDLVGNPVEIKNLQSGQSNSMIMDYFNQFPIASVTNATYSDIAYTSFESDGSGNWTIPSSSRNGTSSLTGKWCYDLGSGTITRSGLNSTTNYIISVWAKTGATVNINGIALSGSIATQNSWNLFTKALSGITSVSVSGSGLIDELRLYPGNANMQTKTYEPFIGQTSSNDANNTVVYSIYDFANRLKLIKDKDLNVLKEYEYDTTTKNVNTAPNWRYVASSQCETPLNGNIDTLQRDSSVYSYTYNATRWLFTRFNCATCQPSCGSQGFKLINCICTAGVRQNVSSVHTKINGTTWVWVCTYEYCFPDGSSSILYTENDASPCTVVGACSD